MLAFPASIHPVGWGRPLGLASERRRRRVGEILASCIGGPWQRVGIGGMAALRCAGMFGAFCANPHAAGGRKLRTGSLHKICSLGMHGVLPVWCWILGSQWLGRQNGTPSHGPRRARRETRSWGSLGAKVCSRIIVVHSIHVLVHGNSMWAHRCSASGLGVLLS